MHLIPDLNFIFTQLSLNIYAEFLSSLEKCYAKLNASIVHYSFIRFGPRLCLYVNQFIRQFNRNRHANIHVDSMHICHMPNIKNN